MTVRWWSLPSAILPTWRRSSARRTRCGAYAISLKLWFEFLGHAAVSWDQAGVEDVARFVGWLRAPAGNVIVLADGSGVRGPATVNRYLAGVFGFYDHHARTGLQVAAELVSWRRVSRGSYKPFLHHVTKGRPVPVRPVKLHVPRQAPRTLEPGQIVAILGRSEEHTSELQSHVNLVCRLLLEKKKT